MKTQTARFEPGWTLPTIFSERKNKSHRLVMRESERRFVIMKQRRLVSCELLRSHRPRKTFHRNLICMMDEKCCRTLTLGQINMNVYSFNLGDKSKVWRRSDSEWLGDGKLMIYFCTFWTEQAKAGWQTIRNVWELRLEQHNIRQMEFFEWLMWHISNLFL